MPTAAIAVVALLVTTLTAPSAFAQPGPPPQPVSPFASAPKLTDEQIIEDLKLYLDQLAARDAFSGAVLLAKNDTVLFEHAYGYANRAFAALNNVDTKFSLASVTKMFTAVAIMQLAQAGKLSLDDTLLELIPDYPNRDAAGKITVRHLLTHSAGLGDIHTPAFWESNITRYQTLQSYLPLIVREPLLFEPGTQHLYSNAGFIVLGLIVEKLTNQTYYDYVHEYIFKPAGMSNTGFFSVVDDVPNLALGYTEPRETRPGMGPRKVVVSYHPGTSAGGCYSTVRDMLRFSLALQNHKLLDAEHTDLLFSGLGIGSRLIDGVKVAGFSGGSPGVNAKIDIYPDLGYTAVVLSNYHEAAEPVQAWLQLALTKRVVPQTTPVAPADLQKLAGKYQPPAPAGGQVRRGGPRGELRPDPQEEKRPFEVVVDGDGLQVDLGPLGKHRFLPSSPTRFYDEKNPASILTFTLNEQGEAVSMSISGGNISIRSASKLP